MLGRVVVGRGSGDGRLGFAGGLGRFDAWFHDQIKDLVGPFPIVTIQDLMFLKINYNPRIECLKELRVLPSPDWTS